VRTPSPDCAHRQVRSKEVAGGLRLRRGTRSINEKRGDDKAPGCRKWTRMCAPELIRSKRSEGHPAAASWSAFVLGAGAPVAPFEINGTWQLAAARSETMPTRFTTLRKP